MLEIKGFKHVTAANVESLRHRLTDLGTIGLIHEPNILGGILMGDGFHILDYARTLTTDEAEVDLLAAEVHEEMVDAITMETAMFNFNCKKLYACEQCHHISMDIPCDCGNGRYMLWTDELKLENTWECWDTGGGTLVYTTDVQLKTGDTVSLGVSYDCIVLYPHKWVDNGDWDTDNYIFAWNFLEMSATLRAMLLKWLSISYTAIQILRLFEDCFKIQHHLRK